MTSFSEKHAPPPRPLGPEIPAGVRRAILSWFSERGVDPEEIRKRWFQRLGYGSVDDVLDDVRERWDDITSATMLRDLEQDEAVARWSEGAKRWRAATLISYLHVPAPLYLDYVQHAIAKYVEDRAIVDVDYIEYAKDPMIAPVTYLNELFAARRIDYRFNENGLAEWHGDEGTYFEVIRPALDVLDDPRLVGCRQEFEAALGHLRAGRPKDREDAIEEAGKAVESAMKVILDDRNIPRTGKENAEKLWELVRDAGVVETPTHHAILATAGLRNEWGGHGQGAEIRQIPDGIPELAVRTAAAAIAYVAALLP